jgi:hypothetical protein
MREEIWKDIPGYEGYYQVSNLGNVRSSDRVIHTRDGSPRFFKGVILKPRLLNGYKYCSLSTNGDARTYQVHQLVAMAFLNHKPNGHSLVVDHINGIKTDNRLENLQIVTNRYNLTKDKKSGTSKYIGVSWHSKSKKWLATIHINGKSVHLGSFTDEVEAALAYQKALKEHLTPQKH